MTGKELIFTLLAKKPSRFIKIYKKHNKTTSTVTLATKYPSVVLAFSLLNWNTFILVSQPTFTCSEATMETPDQFRNLFTLNSKDTRVASVTSLWCLCC